MRVFIFFDMFIQICFAVASAGKLANKKTPARREAYRCCQAAQRGGNAQLPG